MKDKEELIIVGVMALFGVLMALAGIGIIGQKLLNALVVGVVCCYGVFIIWSTRE